MDSVLRPRDIQARIRSGENPDTVAAAAQTTVEQIMPFAGPVLAERAFVAQQAQRASVRRRLADGPARHLGEAATDRLTALEVDPGAVAWDAWRRDDGRWTLVALYAVAGSPRRATFVFDAAGRYVTAEDDEARWLVSERSVTEAPDATPVPEATAETSESAPEPVAPPRREPRPEPRPGLVVAPDPVDTLVAADEVTPPRAVEPDEVDPVHAEPAPDDAAPAARRPARPKRRSSVPSWDEIMFGSR